MAFSIHSINFTSLWTSISIGFYNSCAHAPFCNAFPLVFTLHDRRSIVFNGVGWGGWGMMLTFLDLADMVDATQHDGVGWVGNDVNVP